MAQSRELIIDASVARASGGKEATHPTAAAARDFLQAVLTICHKAVMTPAIRDEWDKHQSPFARKWRRSMMARKKLNLSDSKLKCNTLGFSELQWSAAGC